jgi:hypothetical protein
MRTAIHLGRRKISNEYDDEGRLSKFGTCHDFEGHNVAGSVTLYEYRNDDFGGFTSYSFGLRLCSIAK